MRKKRVIRKLWPVGVMLLAFVMSAVGAILLPSAPMQTAKAASIPAISDWTLRASANDTNAWQSVTYGNGLFVAVAGLGTGKVMTSPDGIGWTSRECADDDGNWLGVTYGNGLFVAIAGFSFSTDSRVMTSLDGITWTLRESVDYVYTWLSITYGNGLFVTVAYGKYMTSPDGISWTSCAFANDTNFWQSVTYGNGLFVTVAGLGFGTDSKVMTADLIVASNPDDHHCTITYQDENGGFISSRQIEKGQLVATITAPEIPGHTFSHWQVISGNAPGEPITQDTVLRATYTINSYTVTYILDAAGNNSTLEVKTVEYQAAVPDRELPPNFTADTEHYIFTHWEIVSGNALGEPITQDTILRAAFKRQLQVRYRGEKQLDIHFMFLDEGSIIPNIEPPSAWGFENFVEWQTVKGNRVGEPITMYTELKAVQFVNHYVHFWHGVTGEFINQVAVREGTSVTIPAMSFLGKEHFSHWERMDGLALDAPITQDVGFVARFDKSPTPPFFITFLNEFYEPVYSIFATSVTNADIAAATSKIPTSLDGLTFWNWIDDEDNVIKTGITLTHDIKYYPCYIDLNASINVTLMSTNTSHEQTVSVTVGTPIIDVIDPLEFDWGLIIEWHVAAWDALLMHDTTIYFTVTQVQFFEITIVHEVTGETVYTHMQPSHIQFDVAEFTDTFWMYNWFINARLESQLYTFNCFKINGAEITEPMYITADVTMVMTFNRTAFIVTIERWHEHFDATEGTIIVWRGETVIVQKGHSLDIDYVNPTWADDLVHLGYEFQYLVRSDDDYLAAGINDDITFTAHYAYWVTAKYWTIERVNCTIEKLKENENIFIWILKGASGLLGGSEVEQYYVDVIVNKTIRFLMLDGWDFDAEFNKCLSKSETSIPGLNLIGWDNGTEDGKPRLRHMHYDAVYDWPQVAVRYYSSDGTYIETRYVDVRMVSLTDVEKNMNWLDGLTKYFQDIIVKWNIGGLIDDVQSRNKAKELIKFLADKNPRPEYELPFTSDFEFCFMTVMLDVHTDAADGLFKSASAHADGSTFKWLCGDSENNDLIHFADLTSLYLTGIIYDVRVTFDTPYDNTLNAVEKAIKRIGDMINGLFNGVGNWGRQIILGVIGLLALILLFVTVWKFIGFVLFGKPFFSKKKNSGY